MGEFSLAAGLILEKAIAKKIAARIGGRIAVKIVGHVGSAATGIGVVLTIGMVLYDIASLLDALGRAQLDEVIQAYWKEVKDSSFKNALDEKVYYRRSYFDTDPLKEAFDKIDSYHTDSGVFDQTGVGWEKMNWRAIVPMHRLGFDIGTIEKSIKIDADPEITKHTTIANQIIDSTAYAMKMKAFTSGTGELSLDTSGNPQPYSFKNLPPEIKDNLTLEQIEFLNSIGKSPMSVKAAIDYFEIVSAPENAEKTFESGKTYETVAKELSQGEFIPDKDHPENLEPQNQCINIYADMDRIHEKNPQYSRELLSHTWDHDVFRQKLKS